LGVRYEESPGSGWDEDEFDDAAFLREDGTSFPDAGLVKHFPVVASGGPVKRRRITARHDTPQGDQVEFLFKDESDGSRRLMHLLPALFVLKTSGGAFVIDELERSMHPMLARKLVEFFINTANSLPSQVIFTTHESTLLDLDLMRRDEIWFAEKDQAGATHLYSLADFKVRKDLRIEKGYFDGRFGAIPFLGGIDRLIEEQSSAEAPS
jgi:AAA15 family ATPase/GTPase